MKQPRWQPGSDTSSSWRVPQGGEGENTVVASSSTARSAWSQVMHQCAGKPGPYTGTEDKDQDQLPLEPQAQEVSRLPIKAVFSQIPFLSHHAMRWDAVGCWWSPPVFLGQPARLLFLRLSQKN